MRESDLYPGIVKGGLAQGWSLYRIADGSPGLKPFDIAGADPFGRAVGLEIKCVSDVTIARPIPWKLFARHQQAWLGIYCARNAWSLVGLYDESRHALFIIPLNTADDFGRMIEQLDYVLMTQRENVFYGWQYFNKSAVLTPR